MNSRVVIAFFTIIIVALLAFATYRVLQSQRPSTGATPTPAVKLPDYADTDVQVRFVVIGPVTANELHNTLTATVGKDNRTIEVLNSYENFVQASDTSANNQTAYDDFLHALQIAGFIKPSKSTQTDDRGVCATGLRYEYDVVKGDKTLQHLWSTSCGGQGTFGGEAATVRQLFQVQFPNYSKFSASAKL